MNTSGIELDSGSIGKVISQMIEADTKLKAALLLLSDTIALKMEEWARDNAKWQDQTTHARQNLKGKAYFEDSNTLVIALSHGMDYGVWLELAHERKYAILERTLEAHKDEIMRNWKKIVGD